MTNCVTPLQKKSAEYRAAMEKFNITSGELEMLLHEYQNLPENAKLFQEGKLSFPPDSFIQERLYGKSETVAEANILNIYNNSYSNPIMVDTIEAANSVVAEASKWFDRDSIKIHKTKDNKYQVLVTKPTLSDAPNTVYSNKTDTNKIGLKEFLLKLKESFVNIKDSKSYIYNLIHSFNGSLYLKKLERLDPKSQSIVYDTALAKEAFMDYIKLNGLEKVVQLKEYTNSTKVEINESALTDYIEEAKAISDLFENTEEAKQVLNILNFLKGKFNIDYKVISSEEAKQLGVGKNDNAFYDRTKNTAYFIKGRKLNANIAAEEMLHPLISGMYKNNTLLFNDLLSDAKQLYPKLRVQIEKAYSKDSREIIDQEIVTQALSRAFAEERKNNPRGNKIADLLKRFSEWLVSLFKGEPNFNFENEKLTIEKFAAVINSELQLNYENTIEGLRFNKSNEESALSRNQEFFRKQSELKQQLDNVYGVNAAFTGEEFRQIATDISYKISDIITEVEKSPEKATFYNKNVDVDLIRKASRQEILAQLGVQNVLDFIKDNYFSINNTNLESFEDLDLANLVADNMDAFITQGASLLAQLEQFGITNDKTLTSEVDSNTSEIDLNNTTDTDEIQEIEGSLQEHWQTESRTENAYDKASILVKQALTQCYKLNPDGTPTIDKWGFRQRMDGREAMQSIIKWTQGALSLSSMITKLEAQVGKNKWVQPIIDRLKDTSGKESSFQSQFFGTISKYFQLYSVGKKENKVYTVFEVNRHPALTDAKRSISGMYNAGSHPLFDSSGKVNTTALKQLDVFWGKLKTIKNYTPEKAEEIADILSNVSTLLGYPISQEALLEVLDDNTFSRMTIQSLQFIVDSLQKNKDTSSWQPFSGKREDNGIINNIGKFIEPITEKLEETVNTSFYDSGNMYQSFVTPSYVTKLIQKFNNSTDEEFSQFIQNEYGKYAQFKFENGWRNSWLELLDNNPSTRKLLTHKVQLNFDGNKYMINRGGAKAMSEAEVTLSIIAEYFKENGFNSTKSLAESWFRIPLMSNKPSSEYIKFLSYRGPKATYKSKILNGCMLLFGQEISRIQTVKRRNEVFDKDAPEKINNFDGKRGLQFCFFDFLNEVENTKFHELVDKVTDNKATEEEKLELANLARTLINEGIENEFTKQIEIWRNNGVVEAAKTISGIKEGLVEDALENFFWNDFLAANNILNLTVTDLAYYKNTEDVQKRLAQLHAPGIRANVEARDFNGNRVADSKTRTLYLQDVVINPNTLKSNIIENLRVVFDNKLDTIKDKNQRDTAKALYDNIIKQFETDVNVADAQGYASPTSYRKKALLFGKWNTHSEEIYQKLMSGKYTYTDLQVAFQPLKPFVYTQIEKDTGVDNVPLPSVKMGVQNKNSEYLLIMAGAILQNEETGKPNYLKALYEIMEESHKGDADKNGNHIPRVDGIDTIQFESTVKAGLTGRIDITQAETTEEAKELLEDLIYSDKDSHLYDKTYVQELNFEDYCIQQEIPEHFKDHEQQQGSQIRMITVSDLNSNMTYSVEGRNISAKEFRTEYENTIAENIEESLQSIRNEFFLDNPEASLIDRNAALAKVLQNEILSSPRYGLDLLMSCMLDSNGKFLLPLGDAIQSKRIEQLINSIVKNRVNKQKIAGGPIVQVSNFGTSRQLNIRFKAKDGSTLDTLNEYISKGKTEEEWKNYIKENQSGIAYYEAFVPAYTQDIFRDFMDSEGNIDIESIEATDPDLLKMIGYRIPSEDKYSMVPIKVVGFMPKEAGDGIMLPYEITLITGSDRISLFLPV